MELDIIHIDMDAFYAAIEQRDNPALQGKPVIIGGTGTRGVVSTASYEARKYGIHSAMPIVKARQLCSGGIYLKPDHSKYRSVSKKLRHIFLEYSELVEPLALDESYLDVSNNPLNSIQIARQIKRKIKNRLNLAASVGVSYNKFLAKLASDYKKPNGFMIISPSNVKEIINPMGVEMLWGVGPKTATELKALGLHKIKHVAQADPFLLIKQIGSRGYQLYKLANGCDNRKVTPPGMPKSIGKETTFKKDIANREEIRDYIILLGKKVAHRLAVRKLSCKRITIKIKYYDFNEFSRSQSFAKSLSGDEVYKKGLEVFSKIKLKKKVRLVGISAGKINSFKHRQLKLFT